jgi:hypothetical protein
LGNVGHKIHNHFAIDPGNQQDNNGQQRKGVDQNQFASPLEVSLAFVDSQQKDFLEQSVD